MIITQKSAKEIVRDLYIYEQEMSKNFKGDKNSNEYFRFLREIFMKVNLEKIDSKNYKLSAHDKIKNPIFPKNTKKYKEYLQHYFLEISHNTDLYGLTRTYEIAQPLFNEIFQ